MGANPYAPISDVRSDEQTTVNIGTLDYDADFDMNRDQEESHENPREIQIRVISQKSAADAGESTRRHEMMQAEADEHYRILVQLQKIDAEFDASLRTNYDRKREVEAILDMSEHWQMFIKTIHASLG